MASGRTHPLAFVLLALSFAVVRPSTAHADSFVPAGSGGPVSPVSHRVLINKTGPKLVVIDDIVVLSRATNSVWLRAFPTEPVWRRSDPALFDMLEQRTIVREPHNQAIRRNLFGPSVVTVLTKKLGEPTRFTQPPKSTKSYRSLDVTDLTMFKGTVITSTITRELMLPEPLQRWLTAHGAQADNELKMALSAQLNRGWVVMAAHLQDKAPSPDIPARVGPLRFEMQSSNTVYPILRHAGQTGPSESFEMYMIDSVPLASPAHKTIWNTRPWEAPLDEENVFVASYSSVLDARSPLGFELKDRFAVPLPMHPFLVRARFVRPQGSTWDDIELGPSRDLVKIPGGTRRGSPLDLFLCVVLGLAPLIYTPESWFLIWLVNAAKERARKEGSAFGIGLWAMFALAVAGFWIVTLEGPGRIAAALPFLIGLGRLAIPYTDRDAPRIRAAFKSKKKG